MAAHSTNETSQKSAGSRTGPKVRVVRGRQGRWSLAAVWARAMGTHACVEELRTLLGAARAAGPSNSLAKLAMMQINA